jgi:hypothetical protein
VTIYKKQEGCRRKHGLSQMKGVYCRIPKEEHAYFSFMHEAGIRREVILNDMIH